MRGEAHNVLDADLVVELSLILGVLETEGGKDYIAWVELAEGRVAEEVADV